MRLIVPLCAQFFLDIFLIYTHDAKTISNSSKNVFNLELDPNEQLAALQCEIIGVI